MHCSMDGVVSKSHVLFHRSCPFGTWLSAQCACFETVPKLSTPARNPVVRHDLPRVESPAVSRLSSISGISIPPSKRCRSVSAWLCLILLHCYSFVKSLHWELGTATPYERVLFVSRRKSGALAALAMPQE